MATRKTHIVRCPADPDNPDALYVDVEVLDALAFIGPNGQEMILRFKQDNIDPVIVDDVGSGNAKDPGANGTRRSHMEQVDNDKTKIFVEVLDNIAFSDQNGQEWILNMPSKSADERNTTEGTGSDTSTRKTHNEKISQDFSKNPTTYLTVTRTDEVAFRTVMGEELIVRLPSCDDPNSSDKRADTITTPQDYDPKDESGPKPPINKDKNVYIAFPKDAGPDCVNTKDAKISQGMLWWIRKISSLGSDVVFLTLHAATTCATYKLGVKIAALHEKTFEIGPHETIDINDKYGRLSVKDGSGKDVVIKEGEITTDMLGKLFAWSYTPIVVNNPDEITPYIGNGVDGVGVTNVVALNWGLIKATLGLTDNDFFDFVVAATADIGTRTITVTYPPSYEVWTLGDIVENPGGEIINLYNVSSGTTERAAAKNLGPFYGSFASFSDAVAVATETGAGVVAWRDTLTQSYDISDYYRFTVDVDSYHKFKKATVKVDPDDATTYLVEADGTEGFNKSEGTDNYHSGHGESFANWTVTGHVNGKDLSESGSTLKLDPEDTAIIGR